MSLIIEKNTVVSLDYHVTDPDGAVLDGGREPLVYLHGGYGDIFTLIELQLEGKKIGDSITVKLQPEEAFGPYDEELVQVESIDQFPSPLEIGMQFEGSPADENEENDENDYHLYRVTDIADDKVVLDGNHPLAGMALIFNCTVTDIRPASADEISEGQVDEIPEEEQPTKH